jgi:protocatechuate 3,4-dioxygenase beta subunit
MANTRTVELYRVAPLDESTNSTRVVPGYRQTALRSPALALQRRPLTLSEFTGPADLAQRLSVVGADLAGYGRGQAIGQLIHVRLEVVDEDGTPMAGTMVEMWQANAAGRYIHPNDDDHAPIDPNFQGAARVLTDESGKVEIRTVRPGAYPVPDTGHWWRPPHIHFSVWGRVWLSRLVTQMFFPGDPFNAEDRILNAVPDATARERLVARAAPTSEGPSSALVFEHRLVVRGARATPAV